MTQSFRSRLGKRLRSTFNVRVRLLLAFLLLIGALAAMAQMFAGHVTASRAIEHEFEDAQARLRVYSDAQDAVMQYRIFLLRSVLYAAAMPAPETASEGLKLQTAQTRMREKLDELALIDAAEANSIRSLLPDTPGDIAEIRRLSQAGDREQLAAHIGQMTTRFNELHQRLLTSMQRNHDRADDAADRAAELHENGLTLSVLLILGLVLAAVLLTYLILRGVVVSLHRTALALDAIPAQSSAGAARSAPMGDEFDQMAHALEQLRASTAELKRLAYVHPLTGLPNSVKLGLELDREIRQANEMGVALALLFVDLNDFRAINDAIGHDTGDACLRELGQRLQALTAPRDAVFHFSGDLFAVYLEAPVDEVRLLASTLAGRIHAAVLQPVEAAGRSLRMTASISIALFPEHADDARSLIGAADAAVHLAKRQGRDNTLWANRDLAVRADANLKLTEDIQRGIKAGEFIPHFEPIIDIQDDRVIGAEALLRWQHPTEGLLRPARFLDVAEQTGQLYPMTFNAFRHACAQFAQWPGAPYLTFNLSPRQIRPQLATTVRRVLQETGMSAERLELEITENALMDRVEQAAQILTEVRDAGVRLSLDDFGTGYSSLSYLQRLPVNKLKIDRSFVSRLDHSRASQAVINAMLGVARNLHLDVVVEGVETLQQMDILASLGVRYMQGYLFSQALPADQLAEWMKLSPTQHLAKLGATG